MENFTVVYRTGGTMRFRWARCAPVATRPEADAQAASIERMGYRALVAPTARWDAAGLPETWDA